MNSGEICHYAKIFMGAGEGKIAEMIQHEPGREQAGAGAGQAGTSRGRSRPGRNKPGQEQPRQEQARQEQLQQEQPWKNGSEYQTTKCSAYQVEYKCITIVSGAERTGERR